jgi:hypothetical protein
MQGCMQQLDREHVLLLFRSSTNAFQADKWNLSGMLLKVARCYNQGIIKYFVLTFDSKLGLKGIPRLCFGPLPRHWYQQATHSKLCVRERRAWGTVQSNLNR